MQKMGGILWLDDHRESQVISNFKQVFGHTPTMGKIDVTKNKNGVNINIDCGLNQVLEIDENGNFSVIDTDLPNFYLVGQEKRNKKARENIDKLISYGTF
jgi:hypothetical protein